MFDLLTEDTFPLADASLRLPRLRAGRPVHAQTIRRWAMAGLHGVRLETALLGGVRVTSADALRRFFTALNSQGVPDGRVR